MPRPPAPIAQFSPYWLHSAPVQQLAGIFARANVPLYFVGGCVRDAVLGRTGGDVDATTPLPPLDVQALLQQAGVRTIPTGIDHGTITALLGEDATPIEITTFRRDTACDGRHAQVQFGTSMLEDAKRRDFTMNALYLDAEGKLYDPAGSGYADAQARKLCFIGDAAERIREDGLRVLRYYRFVAQLGLPELQPEAHAACTAAASALDTLSGERIQAEMMKLLAARTPALAWNALRDAGLLKRLIPANPIAGKLDQAHTHEALLGLRAQPLVRLAYLLAAHGNITAPLAVDALVQRWRLSNKHRDRLRWLVLLATEKTQLDRPSLRRMARLRGLDDAGRAIVLSLLAQLGPKRDALLHHWHDMQSWPLPVLPIGGKDLLALGMTPGEAMGRLLQRLEAEWESSDYQLTREQLLTRAKEWHHGA